MNIIECKDITKRFGQFTALDNVSIDVPEGKIFGLLGPNGAGKTTLIRIINQITIPTEGTVMFHGSPMIEETVRQIGYLPEERGLYKKMKVGDQAMYLARLKGMIAAEASKALREWFVKFEIRSWWDKKVEDLSKGMAQKVQFITTVVHKPKLLILDEPFSGFDPVNVQLIRDEILRLRDEGTSIILSTHNMESVEELCDNIALINKSKLIVTGATDEVRQRWGSNQVELLYNTAMERLPEGRTYSIALDDQQRNERRAVLDINDGFSVRDVLGEINPEVDIISFKRLIPRMNDIFIKLVGGQKEEETK
ncbi:MAG: ATP-binding cassette domain-containing protein [Bacteroidales bacterium]|nr:ATP-binding cassette domain-containing protein [Bacteroidales bacterium]